MTPRTHPATLLSILLLALVPTGIATGQDRGGEWIAQITGQSVNVRCGPGEEFYVCAQVNSPTRVRAAGESDGWLRIYPVRGCFTAVRKGPGAEYDSLAGTLEITEPTWVYAGGQAKTPPFPKLQGRLPAGASLRVLGEVGDYYKVLPPRGAYWYISADFARRVGEVEDPSPAPPAPRPQPQDEPDREDEQRAGPVPADEDQEQDDLVDDFEADLPPADTDEAAGPAAEEQPEVDDLTRSIEALDVRLTELLEGEANEEQIRGLIADYRALPAEEGSLHAEHIEYRAALLERHLRIQRQREQARVRIEQALQREKQRDLERARITVALPDEEIVEQTFSARGLLAASEIYPGRYVLRDPQSRRILHYLRPADASVELDGFLGQIVGIFGTNSYDNRMDEDILLAEQVEWIADGPELPPELPDVRFSPPPAPPVPPAEPADEPAPAPAADTQRKEDPPTEEGAVEPADSPAGQADEPEEVQEPAPAVEQAPEMPADNDEVELEAQIDEAEDPAPAGETAARPEAPDRPQAPQPAAIEQTGEGDVPILAAGAEPAEVDAGEESPDELTAAEDRPVAAQTPAQPPEPATVMEVGEGDVVLRVKEQPEPQPQDLPDDDDEAEIPDEPLVESEIVPDTRPAAGETPVETAPATQPAEAVEPADAQEVDAEFDEEVWLGDLPETGLEMAEPTTAPAEPVVNEEEYR